jgi:hypothetical protein
MPGMSKGKNCKLKDPITKMQMKDMGLVLVLISLILCLLVRKNLFVFIAIGFLIVDIIFPLFYLPLAKIWFGFSKLIGTVISKVILSILFYTLVTPVGIIRGFMGADRLMLKSWKKDDLSVFKDRNHQYGRDEIERPF